LAETAPGAASDREDQGLGASGIDWPAPVELPVLKLGGAAVETPPEWIQVDDHVSERTDLVADVHRLPFPGAMFATVLSLQGLEHSPRPATAVAELHRVLRPGGRLLVESAFVEPLAIDHPHYYFPTEHGALRWLSAFHVESCVVPEEMNPAFALARLFTEVLEQVSLAEGSDVADLLAKTTLGEWRDMWARLDARERFAWELMKRLPPEVDRRFAPVLELQAQKRPLNGGGTR
jgi:SAM-dependent methyltransferase